MERNEKKQSDLAMLLNYTGNYKSLTFMGLFLSAIAMIMGMAPYICIWLVARDLIKVAPNWTEAASIPGSPGCNEQGGDGIRERNSGS